MGYGRRIDAKTKQHIVNEARHPPRHANGLDRKHKVTEIAETALQSPPNLFCARKKWNVEQNPGGKATISRDSVISDVLAGTIVAASNLALAAGFTAVIFQGDLQAGFSTGMWSILVSMIVIGMVVGLLTTLRPVVAGGPDTAVVAVLSLLAGSISSSMMASGAEIASVVTHVLMAITLMAALYGLLIWTLGILGWSRALRFVPFPLIGGFLAATGALLLKGSPEIVLGTHISLETLPLFSGGDMAHQLWFMFAYFFLLVVAHHMTKSSFMMPISFLVAVAICHLAILLGLFDGSNWFVSAANGLHAWTPVAAIRAGQIDWAVIFEAFPEIVTCILVGLFSLVVRISTIEAMRRESADIDHELRIYGLANLLAVPAGAMPGGILFSSSRLIQVAGYRTPLCYFVTASLLLLIVAFGADLSPFLPKPVLGGLLLYLGYTMSIEASRIVFRQSTLNVLLAFAIFVSCLQFGFIVGAIFGILCACLLFAIDCGRTGVVRHHSTRADVSGGTEWPSNVEEHIRKIGRGIHIYELSGFIFFGSSEQLFENIRSSILGQSSPPVSFIVLDLGMVTGFDGAAMNTMLKLQGFADKNAIQIVYCGIDAKLAKSFEKTGVLSGAGGAMKFSSLLEAVYWCENQLLEKFPPNEASEGGVDFRGWLSGEVGAEIDPVLLSNCFLRRSFSPGQEVYRQGSHADTIDFICSGSVIMKLQDESRHRAIRRATRRTVIGEMGFFRHGQRSVSIFADEPLVMYSLTRKKLEELENNHPIVHSKLLTFIIRVLADRVDMVNREISVLR